LKRQYLALLALFVALIALSLWTATHTSLPDIDSRITSAGNGDHQGKEGLIESGGLLLYLTVAGALLAAGIAVYWILGKRSVR
jgi:hypothetical protein